MNAKTFCLDNYKTVFFDLFHTLTYPGIMQHERYEWELFGLDEKEWFSHSMATYERRGLGITNTPEGVIRDILLSARIEFSPEQLCLATEIRIKRFCACLLHIKHEVLSTVETLAGMGIELCLVSNADVIDKMGWSSSPLSRHFRHTVFSCDVGFRKPDLEIYTIALEKMAAKADESLFVGDGGGDEFIGAKKMKMDTLMTTEFITDIWPGKIEEIKKSADFVVSRLSEILAPGKSI